ncbi:MAG: sugar kinase [Bacillati bacterium ANGP1]|uniref:Sugar kinase n=1 Tax=Candidatus Segetimicrobium genomatis TaxID=2569760 RepID=A0A537JJD7_9BACT|nr:MAG: sugar kinase [Terrabacteria group bacterium ANGP1]
MTTVVGIGETLIRLAPQNSDTLESAAALTVHVGGAEANVCASLAHLGIPTAWISRLPANPLGRRIAATIRGFGVNVDGVLWAPDGRVGLMLVQPEAGPRASEVVYYRRDSAFASIDPDEVAWNLLDGARVVHLTGITPALGPNASRLVERAIAEARRRRVRISFDVNYRAKLWDPPATPRRSSARRDRRTRSSTGSGRASAAGSSSSRSEAQAPWPRTRPGPTASPPIPPRSSTGSAGGTRSRPGSSTATSRRGRPKDCGTARRWRRSNRRIAGTCAWRRPARSTPSSAASRERFTDSSQEGPTRRVE